MRKKYYKCLSHKFVDCLSMLSPTAEMSVLLSELDSDGSCGTGGRCGRLRIWGTEGVFISSIIGNQNNESLWVGHSREVS